MLGKGLVNKVRSVGESVVAKTQAQAQVWFHQVEIPREGNQRQIGVNVDPIVSTA